MYFTEKFITEAERLAGTTQPIASAAEPVETRLEIVIQRQARGSYDFTPPFAHDLFLEDFYLRIGKTYRTWNTFKNCWQVRPLDNGMLALIADLLVIHFPGYVARIEHEAALIAA